jgi:hypothetical protein
MWGQGSGCLVIGVSGSGLITEMQIMGPARGVEIDDSAELLITL